MTISDDEDVSLAELLESEILSGNSLKSLTRRCWRRRRRQGRRQKRRRSQKSKELVYGRRGRRRPKRTIKSTTLIEILQITTTKLQAGAENGSFSKIPPEIFSHILKFLSPEDLIPCPLVCRYLNSAASDEFLWRRLVTKRT